MLSLNSVKKKFKQLKIIYTCVNLFFGAATILSILSLLSPFINIVIPLLNEISLDATMIIGSSLAVGMPIFWFTYHESREVNFHSDMSFLLNENYLPLVLNFYASIIMHIKLSGQEKQNSEYIKNYHNIKKSLHYNETIFAQNKNDLPISTKTHFEENKYKLNENFMNSLWYLFNHKYLDNPQFNQLLEMPLKDKEMIIAELSSKVSKEEKLVQMKKEKYLSL